MRPTLEDAIRLAVEAHQGQRDKIGQPYILHPLRVMFRLTSETERIVGVPYEDFVLRSKANPIAKNVKLADLEDNMDVRRMAGVKEEDMQRLIRYRKAWAVLQQENYE